MLGRFRIGTMQGRLLPKYRGRYQAHPKDTWPEEFALAESLGLDLIEFILDHEDAETNPLLAAPKNVLDVAERTGVRVNSICADYFMTAPPQQSDEAARVLAALIDNASQIGVRDIVVPCVDESSLNDDENKDRFVAAIGAVVPLAEAKGVNLSLETDLDPPAFARLLEQINSSAVTVNYDTGNSAALGYKPVEEFRAYGERISDIHIKDRALGGGPVILGEGSCDFDAVFGWLADSDFDGPIIMQAYRDEEGVAVFRRQLDWLNDAYGGMLS